MGEAFQSSNASTKPFQAGCLNSLRNSGLVDPEGSEDSRSEVDHLRLRNNAVEALDKGQMGRVLIQVVLPILLVLKFADEDM